MKLWERLLNGGLAFGATGRPEAPQNSVALPTDDAQSDPLPCGLRVSIVRVVWEIGDRTFDLIGARPKRTRLSPAARRRDAAVPSSEGTPRNSASPGRWARTESAFSPASCQYNDVDLHGTPRRRANWWPAPRRARGGLETFWEGKADKDTSPPLAGISCGSAVGRGLSSRDRHAGPAAASSADALASVLKEERSSPEWAGPFLALHGPFGNAAMICLARQAKEENEKDFLQWVAEPADHSPASVQAACCALIDLGRPGPEGECPD